MAFRKDKTAIIAVFIVLLLVMTATTIYSQDETQQRQDHLLGHLNSSEEERRMDALVQLGALLSLAPGGIPDSTISALAKSLQADQSPVIRALAARTLELAGDQRAPTLLLAALGKEREVAVRKAIVYALARYPSSQVTASLITLLKDKKHEVRAAATYALAEVADPLAANALIEVLNKRGKNEDDFARSQAARGLGYLANREAIQPLLQSLTRDKSEDVRRESARALGKIATKQDLKVIEALREATLSDDPYLTIAADNALTAIESRTD